GRIDAALDPLFDLRDDLRVLRLRVVGCHAACPDPGLLTYQVRLARLPRIVTPRQWSIGRPGRSMVVRWHAQAGTGACHRTGSPRRISLNSILMADQAGQLGRRPGMHLDAIPRGYQPAHVRAA